MRNTTKSLALAITVSMLLSAPAFAARQNVKHQLRNQDQQPSITQRLIDHIKRIFDVPVVTQPTDVPVVTQPTDVPVVTQPH